MKQVIKIFIRIYKKKSASVELNQAINGLMVNWTAKPEIVNLIKALDFTDKEKQEVDKLFVL